jgi:hypothetical protein
MRCNCQFLRLLQIVLLTKRRSRLVAISQTTRETRDTTNDDAIQSISRLRGTRGKAGCYHGYGVFTTVFSSLLQLLVTAATLATTSSLVSFSSLLHHLTTHSRHHRPASSRIQISSPTRRSTQPAVRHCLAGVLLPVPTRYLRLRAHSLPQPPRADTDR